jgi:hypothetical protein
MIMIKNTYVHKIPISGIQGSLYGEYPYNKIAFPKFETSSSSGKKSPRKSKAKKTAQKQVEAAKMEAHLQALQQHQADNEVARKAAILEEADNSNNKPKKQLWPRNVQTKKHTKQH